MDDPRNRICVGPSNGPSSLLAWQSLDIAQSSRRSETPFEACRLAAFRGERGQNRLRHTGQYWSMTLVVPFDGSKLAEAALVRATEFGNVFDEDILAISVIPNGDRDYAREHGWIKRKEEFNLKSVISTLHKQVTDLCPSADFRHKVVDRNAPSGTIAGHLRKVAQDEDASMVFIGSENAGHLVRAVGSVGGAVATDGSYDVVIVRDKTPAKIAKLRDTSPHRKSKSDFYFHG